MSGQRIREIAQLIDDIEEGFVVWRDADEELPKEVQQLADGTSLLLERVSELEETRRQLKSLVSGMDHEMSKLEEENDRLEAENQRLRATLEKREEHLAEVRRGGEWFTDSGGVVGVVEREMGPEGAAF